MLDRQLPAHAGGGVPPERLVLSITVPTRFAARVKLLAERSTATATPLGPVALADAPRISVPAGATVRYDVAR